MASEKPKIAQGEEFVELSRVRHRTDGRRVRQEFRPRDLDPVEARPFANMKIEVLDRMSERLVSFVPLWFKVLRRELEFEKGPQRSAARPEHRSRGKIEFRAWVDGKAHSSGEQGCAVEVAGPLNPLPHRFEMLRGHQSKPRISSESLKHAADDKRTSDQACQ